MSGETCGDCANRGDDPNPPHLATYCFAWHQRINNKTAKDEEFITYYNKGYPNGCPHYASGPQQFRKQSNTTSVTTSQKKKYSSKSGKKWIYIIAIIALILWLISR